MNRQIRNKNKIKKNQMKEETDEKDLNLEVTDKDNLIESNSSKKTNFDRLKSKIKLNLSFSDTVINVLTVSFGVLLATFLNYIVIRQNEKNEAEQFLKGLYLDLEKDHSELVLDLDSFKNSSKGFKYYYNTSKLEDLQNDSIKTHRNFIFNYVLWYPNSGRFEGLKSSGKIYYIENENLRNEILDFYQEVIPVQLGISNYYKSQHERLRIYIEDTNSSKGVESLLLEPKGKIILLKCIALQKPIIKIYENTILKTETIMKLIKNEIDNN